MLSLHEIWRRWTRTRYTRLLEQEVARLRAENRALLNSILGIAGIPPVIVPLPEAPGAPAPLAHGAPADQNQSSAISSSHASRRASRAGLPLRRRSWHQINRTLEFDSARKKEPPGSDQIPSSRDPRIRSIPPELI